jgi:membrane protein YdbS with pleckstrin-like domain
MRDFEALKNIWCNQVVLPKVSHDDVLKKVGETKKAYANKLLLEVLTMGIAIALLIILWLFLPARMWTTHAATIIMIVSCLYYLVYQIRDFTKINSTNSLIEKPEEYISYLKNYKQSRYNLNTKKYKVYALSLGIAFMLYFVEIAFTASVVITIIGAVATAAWFAFCYFVLMRNYIRKEESKIQNMIENLERLQKQFGEG